MESLLQDVRYGFRVLRRNPGFTLIAIVALALGIGANTALFSIVYAVLLKPLPYAKGNELVVLKQELSKVSQDDVGFSVKEVKDYRDQSQSLGQVEEYHQMPFILLDKEPDPVQTGVVSAHFFDLLGVKPVIGRLFVDDDDRPGADPVLVVSYNYWRNKLGGDPNIVGRHFRMNDKVHTVVGVLPPIPQYPRENDVYMPTVACPFRSNPKMIERRDMRMVSAFGRLKPNVSVNSGQADLALIAKRLQLSYPSSYPANQGFTATLEGLQHELTSNIRPMLLVLLGTAGLVLLIACANVANLALARMVRREQELAVRVALGASRLRLVRQLLTESTILAMAGGLLGLLLASSCLSLLVAFAARFTPRAGEVTLNGVVLLFTLIISVLTGLIFGCAPAFWTRIDLVSALKEGSSSSTVKSARHGLRNALAVGQVAISFFLLVGAGLMIRSFIKLLQVDAGYSANNVLTVNVPLNFSKYRVLDAKGDVDKNGVKLFFDRLMTNLRNQPGMTSVELIAGAPLSPGTPFNTPFDVEGRILSSGDIKPVADNNIVSPNAFKLLGVPLLDGRFFTDLDQPDSMQVVAVNQALAHHYFQNEDPLNKRISTDNGAHWLTIVGVVGNVKQYGLDKDVLDTIYHPSAQLPFAATLLIQTAGNPLNYVSQVRTAVYSIDPEQPIADVKTLDELRGDSLAAARLTAILLALFATLALIIATTGLSGVLAFLVSQRTREIGIRMALGARRGDVLWMVLKHGLSLVAVGLIIGISTSLAISRVLHATLYQTPGTDPLTFVLVSILFIVTACLASYFPGRRATRVDPLIALRSE